MLNLIKSTFVKIYDYISFHGIEETSTSRDKDFYVILNQYLFMIFMIFMIHGIFTCWFLGLQKDVIFLWIVSSSSLLFGFFFKRYYRNKFCVSGVFFILIIIVNYYSSINGVESACFLYYFPILSAIPIFFNIRIDTGFVICIASSVLITLYISAYYNFQLWGPDVQENILQFKHEFLLINITCMLLLLGINYIFLEEKRNDYYNTLTRNIYKIERIENLSNEIKKLKEIGRKEELSDENFNDLIQSISSNEFLFLEKFEKFFPYFKNKLCDNGNIILTSSEYALSAMLKLGLSTKEISICINTSLKAVEGRRYRLRKKLNIPSDVDFAVWFSNF